MTQDGRFMVDVGMRNLPFPIRVLSREDPEGQPTVAEISISARIMREVEARFIDTFIRIVHGHRERIGTVTLRNNIVDYVEALKSPAVRITFDFPFFYEKTTPVSGEKCLVRYMCAYSMNASPATEQPQATIKVDIPVLTTYPASTLGTEKGLFAQLSTITVEVEPVGDAYIEDLIDLADRHALAPVYSFLTDEDHAHLIEKVHSELRTSVVVVDEVKKELACNRDIEWYSVSSANYGMLHPYSTVISTQKSMWVPSSAADPADI